MEYYEVHMAIHKTISLCLFNDSS